MYTHTHTHTHTRARARARARAHMHTHMHTHTQQQRCKFDEAISAWYTLDNANVGGAVNCKFYKKYLMKKYFIRVFWKAFEISYKNM